jgi:hypothetical protein
MGQPEVTNRHLGMRFKGLLDRATDSRTKRYLLSVLIFFVSFGCWAIATPMFAVPDEPAHLVRAYGISTGDFSGEPQSKGEPIYSVPKILTTEVCFARNPDQAANCLTFPKTNEQVLTTSSAATYPPFSHLLFSLPFFLSNGLTALYASRLIGAFVCALLFALGLDSLSRSRGSNALTAGVALCLTPMVMLSCASVNPSGMAIAAAFATWSGGLAITKVDKSLVTKQMVMSMMIPFAIYLAIRRDSMLWGVAIMAALLALIHWSTIVHLLKRTSTLIIIGVIATELVLQLFIWGGPSGQGLTESGPLLNGSQNGNAHAAFASLPNYFNEAIGVLGWLDTRMPEFVYIFWGAIFVGLFLLSASVANLRLKLAMFIVLSVFIILPVKVGATQFPYFQGRYALPLLIGAPLLATFYLKESRDSILGSHRSTWTICIFIWSLGVISFAQSLRRYSVGISSGWSDLVNPRWNPPILSTHFLLATYPIVFLGLMMWVFRLFNAGRSNNI